MDSNGLSLVFGPITLGHFLTLAAVLFSIGAVGLFWGRKNLITLLMCIELMLLAANMNFVAFSHFNHDLGGQIFTLIILSIAAAEAAIGLAILVTCYRNRSSINIRDFTEIRG